LYTTLFAVEHAYEYDDDDDDDENNIIIIIIIYQRIIIYNAVDTGTPPVTADNQCTSNAYYIVCPPSTLSL